MEFWLRSLSQWLPCMRDQMVVISPDPKCIIEMDITSSWRSLHIDAFTYRKDKVAATKSTPHA